MAAASFKTLDGIDIADTRDVLHGYARILGDLLKVCRPRRKHWWHASLRPSLTGLTTGVVHAGIDFELELNLRDSRIDVHTAAGGTTNIELRGQPASDVAKHIAVALTNAGLDRRLLPAEDDAADRSDDYSAERAALLGEVINSVAAAMAEFRAGIREETSPLQLWPHHFDLSLLWLPG
ncbi:MAG: DUF5996 family protein, partial [Gammaproteobacteria bacterium]